MVKAPKAISTTQIEIEKKRRRNRVFKYASSKADERFFKQGIIEWLSEEGKPWAERKFNRTFQQHLFSMVHKRNNDGRTLKYCYFNDRHQRVFLDRDFEKWAVETRDEIKKVLHKINT